MYILKSKAILKGLVCPVDKDRLIFILLDLKPRLSIRQNKILKGKLENYKNIEIAKQLKVCPATITNDIKKIRIIIREYLNESRKRIRN